MSLATKETHDPVGASKDIVLSDSAPILVRRSGRDNKGVPPTRFEAA